MLLISVEGCVGGIIDHILGSLQEKDTLCSRLEVGQLLLLKEVDA